MSTNDQPRAITPLRHKTFRHFAGVLVLAVIVSAGVVARRGNFTRPPIGSHGQRDPLKSAEDHDDLPTITPSNEWKEIDDPEADGWQSEAINRRIETVLARLGDLLTQSEPILDESSLQDLATEGFTGHPLFPHDRVTTFRDHRLFVQRATESWYTEGGRSLIGHGPDALVVAIRELVAPFRNAQQRRHKIKSVRISTETGGPRTRQHVQLSGRTAAGAIELNTTWEMNWQFHGKAELPRLQSIQVHDFEFVQLTHDSAVLFSDCTESALGRDESYRQQFLHGMNHWLERSQDTRYFSPLGNPGLAIGDVNGDGLDDLYICQEAGLPNRLFLHQADGTAKDVSERWGVNWLESSRAALLIDLDNDGDQDLVVSIVGGIAIAENRRQQRTFVLRDVLSSEDDTMTLCAADYDNDADIDLYVCVDYPNDHVSPNRRISVLGGDSNRVYHDANNAGRNSLFRNRLREGSAWQFVDVTSETGLDQNNRRFSLAASWEDFDNDGDQDLYVANDFGRNNLYRNQLVETGVARFEDVAASVGVEDSASGMSVSWGDYDRDGRVDVYVGNMFSSAGERITTQPTFKPEASPEVRGRLRRFARGSSLFHNVADDSFADVSVKANVTLGRWAWSSNFLDINTDGWDDLVVANGYLTTVDTGDL